MEAVAEKKGVSGHEGKFLTFALSNEEYGIEILKVREIMGIMEITPVPQTPDYMKGVINLRGKVVPIIDLRLKFAMPEVEHTKETCIIVAEVGTAQVGIIVDSVSEVTDIKGAAYRNQLLAKVDDLKKLAILYNSASQQLIGTAGKLASGVPEDEVWADVLV